MTQTVRGSARLSIDQRTLLLAFALGQTTWKLGCTVGVGQAPRKRTIPGGNLARLHEEIALAKRRFGRPATAPVVRCYQAGRDGCWLHRHLPVAGSTKLVVDSARIEVNRRRRRTKPARLDVEQLLALLIR